MKKFVHDCDGCVFLGANDIYDFYFCPDGGPTVVARFGSGGQQYLSGLEIAMGVETKNPSHPLAVALHLAREHKFI